MFLLWTWRPITLTLRICPRSTFLFIGHRRFIHTSQKFAILQQLVFVRTSRSSPARTALTSPCRQTFHRHQPPRRLFSVPTGVPVGCETDPKSIPKGSKTMPEMGPANFSRLGSGTRLIFCSKRYEFQGFLNSRPHALGAWWGPSGGPFWGQLVFPFKCRYTCFAW